MWPESVLTVTRRQQVKTLGQLSGLWMTWSVFWFEMGSVVVLTLNLSLSPAPYPDSWDLQALWQYSAPKLFLHIICGLDLHKHNLNIRWAWEKMWLGGPHYSFYKSLELVFKFFLYFFFGFSFEFCVEWEVTRAENRFERTGKLSAIRSRMRNSHKNKSFKKKKRSIVMAYTGRIWWRSRKQEGQEFEASLVYT